MAERIGKIAQVMEGWIDLYCLKAGGRLLRMEGLFPKLARIVATKYLLFISPVLVYMAIRIVLKRKKR